jgi:hypothetical protein
VRVALSDAVARAISIAGHPFVVATVMILATTGRRIGLAFLAIAVVPLAVLMIVQVRRGKWEHVDASNRGERRSLYVVGLLVALLWVGYLAISARAVPWRAVVVIAMLLACAVMTRWLKVSLHLFFAAMAAVVVIPMAVLVPPLAWSRLHLRRHTAAEVIAGAVMGGVTGLLLRVV